MAVLGSYTYCKVIVCTGLCRLQYAVDHFAVQFEGKVRNMSVKQFFVTSL